LVPLGRTDPDSLYSGASDPAPRGRRATWGVRAAGVITALAFVGLAVLTARIVTGADAGTGYFLGYVLGAMIGTLGLSVCMRWVFLRATHRAGSLRSPWVLLVATAWLALVLVGRGATTTVEPVPDAAAWVRDATPYSLLPPTSDQVTAMMPSGQPQHTEVRQVMDQGTLVGFVAVSAGRGVDADKELTSVASSAAGASGQGQRITIGGRPGLLVKAGSNSALAFVDGTSYVVTVIAADDATARSIADALIAHAP